MSARPAAPSQVAAELEDLSRRVRMIGCGYRTDPETIATQKDTIASDLTRLARTVERLA